MLPKECKRKNLCADCNRSNCILAGDIRADCPKDRCDNAVFEDCEHCNFIKDYQQYMRNYYMRTYHYE